MGRRNDMPSIFEKIHERYRVPHIGILITGAIILILTVVGTFEFILRSATFTILLYYSITNIAALRQPKKDRMYNRIVPVLGLIGCLVMSVSLPFNVIVSGIGLLIASFVLRFLFHRIYDKPE